MGSSGIPANKWRELFDLADSLGLLGYASTMRRCRAWQLNLDWLCYLVGFFTSNDIISLGFEYTTPFTVCFELRPDRLELGLEKHSIIRRCENVMVESNFKYNEFVRIERSSAHILEV